MIHPAKHGKIQTRDAQTYELISVSELMLLLFEFHCFEMGIWLNRTHQFHNG
jgi:hypothetical protein